MFSQKKLQKGQTLVTLLFFMVMGITITTAALIVVIANTAAATIDQQGTDAYAVAESGAEEGVLRLLRNPKYSGETISVGDGTATVGVTNGIVTSTGSAALGTRTVEIKTVYNNNILSIVSWKEL